MSVQRAAILLFSLGIFSSLGCGGDSICDKADQANRNITNAAASCPSLSGGGDGGVAVITTTTKPTCQSALSKCSAAEQQALSSAFDCLAKVNRCVPGQENQFFGSVLACVLTAGNISPACQTAFGG
jgi:hypothetical protein